MVDSHDITPEIWKEVPAEGFSHYSISSTGRIKGKSGFRKVQVCKGNNWYAKITLSSDRKEKITFLVHRLVAAAFIGPPPSRNHDINHINSVRHDNRVENLEWATRKQNMIHAAIQGRMPKGVRHHSHLDPSSVSRGEKCNHKITGDQVREIRRLASCGVKVCAIAEMFGLKERHTYSIISRNSWAHIE